jgi:hypothetical protein
MMLVGERTASEAALKKLPSKGQAGQRLFLYFICNKFDVAVSLKTQASK